MLLRPPVGEPSHDDAADEAADEDEREHLGDTPLGEAAVHGEVQLQVLHRAADRPDRRHAADREQVERGPAQDVADRARGRRARGRGGGESGRSLLDEEGGGQRDGDHQDAERLQRRPPAERLGEGVGEERDERAADADAEVRGAHRLPARALEPAREQHLVRQRPAGHVPERVQEVEAVEGTESEGAAEAHEREPGHHDSRQHQALRAEPVDDDAGEDSEQRPDDELRERIAGRDLLPRPAEVADEEVVEERQPVEGEADDREEREERGGDREGLVVAVEAHPRSSAFTAFSRAASGRAA